MGHNVALRRSLCGGKAAAFGNVSAQLETVHKGMVKLGGQIQVYLASGTLKSSYCGVLRLAW